MAENQEVRSTGGKDGGSSMKARIPADVEMPDQIFAGLSIRQLAIVATDLLVLWSMFEVLGSRSSAVIVAILGAPIAAAGLVAVTVRPAGIAAESFLLHGLRHLVGAKTMVPATEAIPTDGPTLGTVINRLRPLAFPVEDISEDGTINLGSLGRAVISRASSLNLRLRSEAEQRALVDGFAKVLNSLEGPAQFLIRSERADATELLKSLEESIRTLPNQALGTASMHYARFLRTITSDREVLSRSILVCLKDHRSNDGDAGRLNRRTDEMSSLLREIGVRLSPLDGQQACLAVRRAADPSVPLHPHGCLPGQTVRGVNEA